MTNLLLNVLLNSLKIMTLAGAGVVFAASQGQVAEHKSQGEFNVGLQLEDGIIINNLQDMYLAEYNNARNLRAGQYFCIGRTGASQANGGDLRYTIQATSIRSRSGFYLRNSRSNSSADQIKYKIYFLERKENLNRQAGVELYHNQVNHNNFRTRLPARQCNSTAENASLWVTVDQNDLGSRMAGQYMDTVMLTVSIP